QSRRCAGHGRYRPGPARRWHGCPWPLQRFEAVGVDVLAHLLRVPDAAVHGDVDAFGQRLHRADRATDVELGIGAAEAGRAQRAGHDDGLAGNAAEHLAGGDHRVGAVGDQHVAGRLCGDGGTDQFAVGIGDVQRIVEQDRDQVEAEGDTQLAKDYADLRIADLVVGFVVEIDLVDRATGGDDQELFHHCGESLRDRKSTRLNSSHVTISYAVFCLNKENYGSLTVMIATDAIDIQFKKYSVS